MLIQACSDSHDALANAELLEMLTALFLYKTTQVQCVTIVWIFTLLLLLLLSWWVVVVVVVVVVEVVIVVLEVHCDGVWWMRQVLHGCMYIFYSGHAYFNRIGRSFVVCGTVGANTT